MASQYLYFWIDDRGRILELRVTRRGESAGGETAGRYGRAMTRDLSRSYLRLEDLPAAYADPVREHVRSTGEQQGIVEIAADSGSGGRPDGSGGGDAPERRDGDRPR